MQRITSKIRDERGFTLIEIIMVIVLLGIIAAIAIPKYIDLREEAADATASGIVGAIVSSASIGYADLVTRQAGTTFPDITALDTTYLQAQNITLTLVGGSNLWWGMVGGNTYTFTYSPSSGNSGWAKAP
jgi:prepilin-type N-terminal cleavage/methylation domain-containing protein